MPKSKRFSRIITLALAMLMVVAMAVPAFAGIISPRAETIMDNDALADSGTYNRPIQYDPYGNVAHLGWHDMTWLSSANCLNGDARRGNCTSTQNACAYYWENRNIVSTNVSVYAYLNHSTFNDPQANYYYEKSGEFEAYTLKLNFNQNNAPVGWSYLGAATAASGYGLNVNVVSSANSGKYLGADALRANY